MNYYIKYTEKEQWNYKGGFDFRNTDGFFTYKTINGLYESSFTSKSKKSSFAIVICAATCGVGEPIITFNYMVRKSGCKL
jgi:hypothetical protein